MSTNKMSRFERVREIALAVLPGLGTIIVACWVVSIFTSISFWWMIIGIVALGVVILAVMYRIKHPHEKPAKPPSMPLAEPVDADENSGDTQLVSRASSGYDPEIEAILADGRPGMYAHRRHWKSWVKKDIVPSLVALVTLVYLVYPSRYAVYMPPRPWQVMLAVGLIGAAACYWCVRNFKLWQMRMNDCDPSNGVFLLMQDGLLRWCDTGSPPETYPLDDMELETPRQTIMEKLFFHNSYTWRVHHNGKLIEERDIYDAPHLIEIQKYRKSLPKRRLDMQALLAQRQTEATRALQENNEQMRVFLQRHQLPPGTDGVSNR